MQIGQRILAFAGAAGLLVAVAPPLAGPAYAAGNNYTISDDASCTAFMSAIGATGLGPYSGNTCYLAGTLPAADTLTVTNGYTLRPQTGTFLNNGTVTINSYGNASGGLYIAGTFENAGTFIDKSGATNWGTFINDANKTATLEAGLFGNSGTINNSGSFDIESDGFLDNYNTLNNVGTLTKECGADLAIEDGSTYSGNAPFENCNNPSISSVVTSSKPKTAAGWYRAPVTISYTCSPGDGATYDADGCPAANHVTIETPSEGVTVTGTVTDTDKGFARVKNVIKVDMTAPDVALHGATPGKSYVMPQKVTCSAQDALSGLDGDCVVGHVSAKKVGLVKYAASATDLAGNIGTASGSYTILPPTTKLKLVEISSSEGKAKFRFKAGGYANHGVQCSLVPTGKHAKFKKCTSPAAYKHLDSGRYLFEVRAVGFGGPDPTPAKHAFRIKR